VADREPNLPSFVMAVRTLTYSDPPDGGAKLGVDLDNTCTCRFDQPASCAPRGDGGIACDDEQGRDNGLGALLHTMSRVSAVFREISLSEQLELGQRGILLEVRNWSGAADDPSVVLAMYASGGIGRTDAGDIRPWWNGDDRFTVTPGSIRGGGIINGEPVPIFLDARAYVRDGVLVGRPVGTEPFSGIIGVPVQIASVIVMGRIVRIGAGYGLAEGQLVGRASTRSLLTAIATQKDPFDSSSFLCGSNPNYESLRALVCQGADIRLDPGARDPSQGCDALGVAFGVTAWPARFGEVEAPRVSPAGCGPGYTDDCPP